MVKYPMMVDYETEDPSTFLAEEDVSFKCGNQQIKTSYHLRNNRTSSVAMETNNIEDENKKHQCSLCKKFLSTKETLKKHILSRHIKSKPFECNICPKKFTFEKSLIAHKEIHSVDTNYVCICGKAYKVKSSYIDHIKRLHEAISEDPFVCTICSKSFVDKKTLKIHTNSVHEPQTISCTFPSCDKIFSTLSLMKAHLRYHSYSSFICSECGKSFKTKSYLEKHKLSHSGIRPYKCIECSKTYLSLSHLNQHQKRAHSIHKSFLCSVCGKSFASKEQMTFHENAHKGNKEFSCNLCDYKTSYRGTLCSHKKNHSLIKAKRKLLKANQEEGIAENVSMVDETPITPQHLDAASPTSSIQIPLLDFSLDPWTDFTDENLLEPSFIVKTPDWDIDVAAPLPQPLVVESKNRPSQINKSNVTLNSTAVDVLFDERHKAFSSPYDY